MKHMRYIILSITIGIMGILLTWVTFPEAVTIITTGAGKMLASIGSQNATDDGSGNLTIEVDTLESPVTFDNYSGQVRWSTGDNRLEYTNDGGVVWNDFVVTEVGVLSSPTQFENYSGLLRWNTSDSRIEYTNDDGTNWYSLGEGGNVMYGLNDDGLGVLAEAAFATTDLDDTFWIADWNAAFYVIKDDTAAAAAIFEMESDTYSAVRLQLLINASEQPAITVGTTLGVPGTTTYTCTDATLTNMIQRAIAFSTPFLIEYDFDGGNDEVVCCVDGVCGAGVAAVTDFDIVSDGTDTVKHGSALNGSMFYGRWTPMTLRIASEVYAPSPESGVCPFCTAEWLYNEKTGVTVSDSLTDGVTYPVINLTVTDGVWVSFTP